LLKLQFCVCVTFNCNDENEKQRIEYILLFVRIRAIKLYRQCIDTLRFYNYMICNKNQYLDIHKCTVNYILRALKLSGTLLCQGITPSLRRDRDCNSGTFKENPGRVGTLVINIRKEITHPKYLFMRTY
jgi:hypothetical protein